jgi:hypothetical protein
MVNREMSGGYFCRVSKICHGTPKENLASFANSFFVQNQFNIKPIVLIFTHNARCITHILYSGSPFFNFLSQASMRSTAK